MRRGNGKLLFNLALILIFVSPLQAACMLRCWREGLEKGLVWRFKGWRKTVHWTWSWGRLHWEQALGRGGGISFSSLPAQWPPLRADWV